MKTLLYATCENYHSASERSGELLQQLCSQQKPADVNLQYVTVEVWNRALLEKSMCGSADRPKKNRAQKCGSSVRKSVQMRFYFVSAVKLK